ncbi:MAG: hypothetical protein ACE14V_04075 [bacterium]
MNRTGKYLYWQKVCKIVMIMLSINCFSSITYAVSTKTYQMTDSGDDTFGYTGQNLYTAITTVFGLVGVSNYYGYYRWQIDLPVGAKISYSLVSMRCFVAGSGSPELAIFLVDSANCPSFASSNPSSLAVSLDSVDYPPGTWSAAMWRAAESVNKLIQHFIDNPSYASGNYLGIRIGPRVPLTGLSRYRQTFTYDNSSSYAARLVVYYNQSPAVPIPGAPANGSNSSNLQPQFIWSNSSDPDGDQVYYLFELDTVSTFNSGAKLWAYSTTTSYQPVTDLDPGLWYWRVLSCDSSSCPNVSFVSATSSWSSVQEVILTVNHPPSSVNLISPTISTTNVRYPQFTWSQATDSDSGDTLSYQLQVSTDSSFGPSGLVLDTTALLDTTYLSPNPMSANTYFWRVIALDNMLAANTSAPGWFISFDSTKQMIINSQDTYLFELGSWSSSTEYTPVTLSINSVLGIDTVSITVYNAKHPNAVYAGQYYLSRWWKVSGNGNIKSVNISFIYTDSDYLDANFGSRPESEIMVSKYSSGSWTWYPASARDTAVNEIRLDNLTSFSEWTLSAPNGVPVGLSRFE